MSAPNTNIEKQKGRHKGPLVGIAIALAFAAVLFIAFFGYVWEPVSDAPEGAVTNSAAE